jgi:UDP-N-acetylmuramoyl-tripeptide--D-alanyl-D-alanine ligase
MTVEQLHTLFVASDGISTDTRKLVPNTLFFALRGDNFNGNKFASQALDAGCSYAIVDEKECVVSEKYILVENVLKTIQDLANYHRRQFNIPVIGITGSNGKTTTKELIGAILSTTYNTLITEGNLNNHLGVPFTLLRLNMDHEIAIIEMGASKPGDIRELAEIAEPTHGIITNIGAAHIEGFGSLQGVINTKTELYRFIENTGGTIFINALDDTLINHQPAAIQTISYGESNATITGSITALTPYVNFTWHEAGYTSPGVKSHLVGNYNFTNFLAAICIGRYFNVTPEAINEALSNYIPSNKRSQIEKTKRNTLIVDCYNANATSMMAALQNFVAIPHEKKLAILGDMLELGPISKEEHQKIADYLSDKKMEVILVGEEFGTTKSAFRKFNHVSELLAEKSLDQFNDYLILVKGSRGIKLEMVLTEL